MVASERIVAMTQINPSYSPSGVNVHVHRMSLYQVVWSLGRRQASRSFQSYLHSCSPVCPTQRQTDTHTHRHTDHETCDTCRNKSQYLRCGRIVTIIIVIMYAIILFRRHLVTSHYMIAWGKSTVRSSYLFFLPTTRCDWCFLLCFASLPSA